MSSTTVNIIKTSLENDIKRIKARTDIDKEAKLKLVGVRLEQFKELLSESKSDLQRYKQIEETKPPNVDYEVLKKQISDLTRDIKWYKECVSILEFVFGDHGIMPAKIQDLKVDDNMISLFKNLDPKFATEEQKSIFKLYELKSKGKKAVFSGKVTNQFLKWLEQFKKDD
ncbi:MAG: hypothetical protein ACTSYF_07030 [Promethearchaeota archaeon]